MHPDSTSFRWARVPALMTAPLLLVTSIALATAWYRVDPTNSSVKFTIDYLVFTTVTGSFKEFEATIEYDPNDITRASLAGIIEVASIDTGNETRDNHLRDEDFFDVRKHPKIQFQSKRVERKGNSNFVVGDLTMRGVVREIEIPFSIESDAGDGKIGFSARLKLNRQDYGIAYGGFLDSATVGDIVSIELTGEAIRR